MGVNPVLYWTLRAILVPFFLIYFRMQRIGRRALCSVNFKLLGAPNHRSFLDPFVIGTLVRRPVYYMAKRELFENRLLALQLVGLGFFLDDRGAGDSEVRLRPPRRDLGRMCGRFRRAHACAPARLQPRCV